MSDADDTDVGPLLRADSSEERRAAGRALPFSCSAQAVSVLPLLLVLVAAAGASLALSWPLLLLPPWLLCNDLQRCLSEQLQLADAVTAVAKLTSPAPPSWSLPTSTFRHLHPLLQSNGSEALMWKDAWEREAFNSSDAVALQRRVLRDEATEADVRPRWRMFCHAQHMKGYGAGCFNILYAVAQCLAMAELLHLDVSLSGYHPLFSSPNSVRMSSVLDYRQLERQLQALDVHIRLSDWRIDYQRSTPYLTQQQLLQHRQQDETAQSQLRLLDPTAAALPALPAADCSDSGCSDCPSPSMCSGLWQGESAELNDWPWVPKLAWYLDRPLRDHAYEPWLSMFAKPPTQSSRMQQLVVALMRDLPFTAVWQQRAKAEQLRLRLHGQPYYALHLRVELDYQGHVDMYERESGKQFSQPWVTRALDGLLQLMVQLMPNRSAPLFIASGLDVSDPLYLRVLHEYPAACKSKPELQRDENAIVDYLVASEAVAFVGVYASSFSHALHNRHSQLGRPSALLPLYTSMFSPWYDMPPPHQQRLLD